MFMRRKNLNDKVSELEETSHFIEKENWWKEIDFPKVNFLVVKLELKARSLDS